jgi:membrane protease YdiL (CAAX protease family)
MECEEDTYHSDAFHKKQHNLKWGRIQHSSNEERYHQSSFYKWFVIRSMSPGRTVAILFMAIVFAELLLFAGNIKEGMSLHFLILISMPFLVVIIRNRQGIYALQALMLLPLLRLINVSMPVSEASLLMFIAVYVPLLVPVYLLIRHQGLTDVQLGVSYKRIVFYIPIAIIAGVLLGAGEYLIVGSGYVIPGLSEPFILIFASIVFFYVGLMEELIFRSLIQVKLEGLFGMAPGLLAASLLFGVMHSISGEIIEMVYIFAVGIVLGYMFQRTRSLPLVATAHGVANIVLFVVLPLVLL